MTQKDILYRLQSSKAKCIITNEVLAPAVDAVASKCENLHSKLIVSQSPREGWENLKEMMKWVTIIVVEQLSKKKHNIDKTVDPGLTRKMKIKITDKGNNVGLGSSWNLSSMYFKKAISQPTEITVVWIALQSYVQLKQEIQC